MQSLIDFALGILGYFQFWVVLQPYERGLVVRLGRVQREIGPGLHFIYPLYIDEVSTEETTITTEHLHPQSLDTNDCRQIVVTPIVKWNMSDIQPYMLTIDDAEGVLTDGVASLVARTVTVTDYDDIFSEEFWREITKTARRTVKKYGMHIVEVSYSDLAEIRTVRLMTDGGEAYYPEEESA